MQRNRGVARGVRKWLTRSELIRHFGDEKVADAVIKRKEDIEELHAEIRDHPELPGNFSEY